VISYSLFCLCRRHSSPTKLNILCICPLACHCLPTCLLTHGGGAGPLEERHLLDGDAAW